MAHPLFHARSSVRKYGGAIEDYLPIHSWFDESKACMGDVRHRALRHHAKGIFQCEKLFGVSITNRDGREVPVRFIGEQHVMEDLGCIPTASDWLSEMPMRSWMGPRSKLAITVEDEEDSSKRVKKKLKKNIVKKLIRSEQKKAKTDLPFMIPS